MMDDEQYEPGPYVQLKIGFLNHPKVVGLSDRAFRLHVNGILYCAAHLTDGFVPSNALQQLVPECDRRTLKTALEQLLRQETCKECSKDCRHLAYGLSLWSPADGGYMINSYLQHNHSRAYIEKTRADNAARQRRFRQRGKDSGDGSEDSRVTRDSVTRNVTRLEVEVEPLAAQSPKRPTLVGLPSPDF